jgi:hypothetical protein
LAPGFLNIADISSPPVISRHLVLPQLPRDDATDESSRNPSLCVFLHGALKVENMCALVQVRGQFCNENSVARRHATMIGLFLIDVARQNFHGSCK